MRANLDRFAVPIKQRVSPDTPMGVGLWLADTAARQIETDHHTGPLRDFLSERGLRAYTLNGFPFGPFHQPVVKQRVYSPDWSDPARLNHTLRLARILAALLPDDSPEGSISTVPVGWPATMRQTPGGFDAAFKQAAGHLMDLVHGLARIELDTGRLIHVNLEPEPGCVLETSRQVVDFFEHHLLGTPDDHSVRSYLRVCHDVCHAAVMFEPQGQALANYRRAGLQVGKVQLSSAPRLPLTPNTTDPHPALDELARFVEPRYLHQTTLQTADGSPPRFLTDLPEALTEARRRLQDDPHFSGELRTHFHVPVHLDRIGPLATTRDQITACLQAIRPEDAIRHFEVETYAWNVLPDPPGNDDALIQGITDELLWAQRTATETPS